MVFNIVEVLKFKPLISHSSSPQRTGNHFPWWLVIHSKERAGDQIAIVNMILVGYNSGYNTNNSDYEYGYLMALYIYNITGWWLSPTPLKNLSSSVGIMTSPIYGKS